MEAMEVVLAEPRRGASGGVAVGEADVGGDADGRGVNESLRHWRRFHLCQLQMARPLRESRRLMLISSLHNENVRTSSRLSAAAISASAHVCCGGPRIVVRPTPVFEYIYIRQGMFIYIAQKEFSLFSIFKKSIPGLINNRAPTRSDGVSRLAALLALPPLLL